MLSRGRTKSQIMKLEKDRTKKAERSHATKMAAMVGSPAQDGGCTYPTTSHEMDTNQTEEKEDDKQMSWMSTINKDLKVMGGAREGFLRWLRTRSSASVVLPDVLLARG